MRAAAVFQHFERTHAQTVAEVSGLVDGGDDNALLMQRSFALFEIHLDMLRQWRLRPRAATGGGSAGSQGESRKQNSTHGNVSLLFAAI
ncbi:MAG: hypothetical protein IPG56_02890 [Caulobacteraceae bacterium]|nr:hypothetical protein [Caulobacteraceae bacterium]